MINGGLLSGSLLLLIGGILLLALTSGTAAVIGLIAAVVGALGIIFGLPASKTLEQTKHSAVIITHRFA